MSGVSPSASPAPVSCSLSKLQFPLHHLSWNTVAPSTSSCPKLKGLRFASRRGYQNIGVRFNRSIGPGGPGSGNGDSRSILDAFFLGKALAEAVNERIESTVGEFLSAVSRLQAEQRKQVQDFQDEVLERAKKAKEKAAREAMESHRLISKSSANTEVADYAASRPSYFATETVDSVQPTTPYETTNDAEKEEPPALSSSTDD